MNVTSLSQFDLTGKVAVVTGGNGGIGMGIAMGLAGAGAKGGEGTAGCCRACKSSLRRTAPCRRAWPSAPCPMR